MTDLAIVILAAGMGTRMKSDMPKVLHRAAGRSLLGHVLYAANDVGAKRIVVVSGPDVPAVALEAKQIAPACEIAIQTERLGTAHAVSMAKEALAGFSGTVLVLYGDAPLILADTLKALIERSKSAAMAVLGFEAADPHGYGRLLLDAQGDVIAIREQADATPLEQAVTLCNSGVIAISADALWQRLPEIKNDNKKKEFYLTDLVELSVAKGGRVSLSRCEEDEVAGVNDRIQLSKIEATFQQRLREQHMKNGATLTAPETVFFCADTEVGQDVIIGPHVVFGPGVSLANKVEILPFCHIEGARVATGARVGPYARLRPGAVVGDNAHIGNFVEIKQADIGQGAKVNHLTYIGDARVGAKSNIGAGTITCNYDGYEKHLTDIGADVFVGSNTALVAPVKVGDGANIAAGSVITRDVPPQALAITRASQETREGWAAKYREIKKAQKARKAGRKS